MRGAGDGIERAEGLVHEQHRGIDGKGTGNGAALLHAAGKFPGQLVEYGLVESDGADVFKGRFLPAFFPSPGNRCSSASMMFSPAVIHGKRP